MVKYCSVFSSLIEKYVNYQKASGSWSETGQGNIMYFDSFCAMHYPAEQLCQEMGLLYSSGIRTTEARYLKRDEVDLIHGVLNIRETKGHAQHYVALHQSMTKLLHQYDYEVEHIYPGRIYFFETANGTHYSRQWVVNAFRTLWEKANGSGNRPVAYDLRHNYAVTNINNWKEDVFEFHDKLHHLSKSMGHCQIESTLYYYSIVLGLADILLDKTEIGFNEIVPEVDDEKEQ